MGNLVHKAPSPEIPARKKATAVCTFTYNLRLRSACDLDVLRPGVASGGSTSQGVGDPSS